MSKKLIGDPRHIAKYAADEIALAKRMRRRLNLGKPSTATQVKTLKRVVNLMKPEVKMVANQNVAGPATGGTEFVFGSGLNASVPGGTVLTGFGFVNGKTTPNQQLIPPLQQGLTNANRIGNVITPKKLVLKYSLYANPSTETGSLPANNNPFINLPFYCRVIVFRHRYAQDDFSQNGILDLGATTGDISGNVESMYEPYNRDEYKILYSKTHYMQPQRHQLTGSGNFTGQNMDDKAKQIVIKRTSIKLPKRIRYNENSSSPADAGFFLAVCVVNSDGTPVSSTQTRVSLSAETYMSFTDA